MNDFPRKMLRSCWLSGWLLASSVFLSAQDLTISGVRWTDLFDPPDTLPVLQGKVDVPIPVELKTATEAAYVVTIMTLDAEGKVLVATSHGTQPALVKAVDAARGSWTFSPAKRGRKGVPVEVALSTVFNPVSAGSNSTDATVRVLEADALWLPARDRDYGGRVIQVDVAVDETGRIAEVKNAPADLDLEIASSLKKWRFAAARHGGQPRATDFQVQLIVIAAPELPGRIPPATKPRKESLVVGTPFSNEQIRRGKTGEVMVSLRIDLEGRVINPTIVRSTNPLFEDAALEGVRKWIYDPMIQDGHPVYSQTFAPFFFGAIPQRQPQKVLPNVDQSKLPEELRHDTLPLLNGTQQAVYPYALLRSGTTGHASVQILIDERGKVSRAVVREASAPEFGHALVAALGHYYYSPARNGERSVKAVRIVMQDFSPDEKLQLMSQADLELLEREKQQPQTIMAAEELDHELTPISQRAPKFPFVLAGKAERGEAMIEFIVDEKGRARLPRIISATEEAFGYMAAQEVASWRFEPPKKGKRAVAVRVRMPIRFSQSSEER